MRFSFRSNHKRHEQRCMSVRGGRCQDTQGYGYMTSPKYRGPTGGHGLSHPPPPTTAPTLSTPGQPCSFDPNRSQYSLALNQFVLERDETQRAMLDFYYNALSGPALPGHAGLNLSHLMGSSVVGYPMSIKSEEKVSVRVKEEPRSEETMKREPEVKVTHTAGTSRGRASYSRKQSHPRRTQAAWSPASHHHEQDAKPNLPILNQRDLPDILIERNKCIDRIKLDSTSHDLKPTSNSLTIQSSNDPSVSMSTMLSQSPEDLSLVNIKTERPSSPVSLIETSPQTSRVQRPRCSTSTSATPSSVAEAEASCSLPFTLDAVLGDLSLQNLIDMLVQNGRIYRCHHCKILFEEYATYVLHMGCHGSTNPFSCHFCGVGFQEKFGFLTHFMKCIGK